MRKESKTNCRNNAKARQQKSNNQSSNSNKLESK